MREFGGRVLCCDAASVTPDLPVLVPSAKSSTSVRQHTHVQLPNPPLRTHKRRPHSHLDSLLPQRRILHPNPLLHPPPPTLPRIHLLPRCFPHALDERGRLEVADFERFGQLGGFGGEEREGA